MATNATGITPSTHTALFVGGPVDGEIRTVYGSPGRVWAVPVHIAPPRVYTDGLSTVCGIRKVDYVPYTHLITAMALAAQPWLIPLARELDPPRQDGYLLHLLVFEPLTRPPDPEYDGLYDPDPVPALIEQALARKCREAKFL